MKLTAGYNVLTYQLGDDYQGLDALGHSRVASLGLDYAIQRSQRHNLYTGIRYEYSDIQDEYRDFWENHSVKYNDKTGNAAVWSLYGDEQDHKGATDWRFEYKFGHIGNDALQLDKEIGGTEKAPTGTYNKIHANILRRQDLNDFRHAASMRSTTSTPRSTSPSAARTACAPIRRARLRVTRAI